MAILVMRLGAALDRRINLHQYLAWSTVISAFLLVSMGHVGIDLMMGYPIVVINGAILLLCNRLTIHRWHLAIIMAITVMSLFAARISGTPINAILAEILGISVLSIYYFSALTNLGIKISRWMELYARVAFIGTVIALILWALSIALHLGDGRLKGIYAEPSFYVYNTLPALGYYVNSYVKRRTYGWEAAICTISFLLADSALGFAGLFLVLIFAFGNQIRGWRLLTGLAVLTSLSFGVYFASGNVRLRVNDTIKAAVSLDLSGVNASTFALLSNVFVTSQTFLTHPITGVGIGGYANAYDHYIGDLTGIDLKDAPVELNRDDASSLFLRVAAELGIPGLIALFAFFIVYGRVRGTQYIMIRNALLPYLIVRATRFGAYFSMELYFFVGLYVLNYLEYFDFKTGHRSGPTREYVSSLPMPENPVPKPI